jgi:predicted amidohydrolase
MARKSKYKVDLKSSTLVIAIAQIEGPLPNGKHTSLVGERNSLAWKTIEDVNARIDKACGILDALNRTSRKADVVVFPEYSLPVMKALPRLHEKANQYGQIIIAGADSIHDPRTKHIYNQSPIIIPHKRSPIWATKRELSQWEQGLVDEPTHASVPVLTWDADGRSHWLSVYICLDFRHASHETKKGGGIFIVPMCSPDVHSFRGWADSALRLEDGTATVFCNCIGGEAVGQSGVVAVVPRGKPFKSAFDLPESEEAVAVFEIDCNHLAPPKITNPDFKFPLGKRFYYSLITATDTVEFTRLRVEQREVVTRAVINPAIFEDLGKKMRMAFLSVENFAEIADTAKDQDFEVLAILGQHDLLVTHLHENRYDMIYDIKPIIRWRTGTGQVITHGQEMTDDIYNSFPFFRVDVYFKVLGVPVTHAVRSVFDSAHQKPTVAERIQIMKLGNDWNDENVPHEARAKFLRRGWILKSTNTQPGEISSIMTIYLDHVGPLIEERQATFEDRVLPELVKKHVVTSIYRGRSQSLTMHYVLRITANVDSLYGLIEEVYKLAADARVSINTTTYVVVKKLSSLSLEKAVLAPMLPADETSYRNTQLCVRLSAEDRLRVIYLPENEQRALIRHYRLIQEAVSELSEHKWLHGYIPEMERKLATGLLNNDFFILKEPHDILQIRVEGLLKEFIEKEVTDQEFDNWKRSLAIQSGKKITDLSYTERIKVVIRKAEELGLPTEMLPSLRDLLVTYQLRNNFAHGNWEKLTIDDYVMVLPVYCNFLSEWELYANILSDLRSEK